MIRRVAVRTVVLAVMLVSLVPAFGAPQRQFNPPFELPAGVTLQEDIIFSRPAGHELRLDLFAPEGGDGPRPAIVFILGSGWRGGDKSHFWRHAAHMASLGFVGICIEHRGSADAAYPAAVDDAKAAVRWLRAHATEYRIDPDRIGAAGGSSGGHLAAFLGVTPEMRSLTPTSEYAEFSATVRAVAAFNPAMDLEATGATAQGTAALDAFLGTSYDDNPELWREASPISHVGTDSAAFLVLHGTNDQVVAYEQSVAMVDALKKAGVRAEMFTADGAGHGFFNAPPWYGQTLMMMTAFFLDTLAADGNSR